MATVTLEDLFIDYNAKFTATTAEIGAWNTLDVVSVTATRLMSGKLGVAAENTVETSVGLFG
jgi:hypothetical protein